ncbi:AMP-binding protein [Alcaligenaceae bacterium]|nr:AMP-binding protein [Alcaligenaceae bacterium]
MNIANWLHATALLRPDAPAIYHGESLYADYRRFAQEASHIGQRLVQNFGLQPGDRVALYMQNRVEYLSLLYAIWWVGAVAVPINYKLHAKEAAWIVGNAQATLLFSDDGMLHDAADLSSCRELGMKDGAFNTLVEGAAHDGLAAPASVSSNTLAWLFYTSGTTGRPKGVMLTHGNLMAMSLCYAVDVDNVSTDDTMLYAAPLSHGAGLYNFVHVRFGARHMVPQSGGFDSNEILGLGASVGNLCFFAAPTMVKRLVQAAKAAHADGAGIKTIVCGGGPMYAADMVDALDTLGPRFAQIYGQGESPMTITAMRREVISGRDHPKWHERLASVGTAHSCVEVRVVSEDMADMPAGDCGEVIVRGSTVMQGYWRNEEATRQTLVQGWLKTGDIGYLSSDGFLTLTDRSKDVIISGGSNIYPREVEEVLARCPGVFEAAVIGAPHPDWGEEVVAFIVVQPGSAIDAAALDAWCKSEIASFKKPKRYEFCPELPKNSYGKILKTELRQRLSST